MSDNYFAIGAICKNPKAVKKLETQKRGVDFCDPGPANFPCNIWVGLVFLAPRLGPFPEAQSATPQAKLTRAEKRKNKSK